MELNRLAELMDSICTIAKGDRSDIENDIVFSGYEDPFSQTDERLKYSLKDAKNYNRRVPDSIKQKHMMKSKIHFIVLTDKKNKR